MQNDQFYPGSESLGRADFISNDTSKKDKISRWSTQYSKRISNSRMIFSERLSFVKITKKVVNF